MTSEHDRTGRDLIQDGEEIGYVRRHAVGARKACAAAATAKIGSQHADTGIRHQLPRDRPPREMGGGDPMYDQHHGFSAFNAWTGAGHDQGSSRDRHLASADERVVHEPREVW